MTLVSDTNMKVLTIIICIGLIKKLNTKDLNYIQRPSISHLDI